MIPYGEYLPDQPDLNNPGCTNAENVIPGALGFRQFPAAAVYSDALTSAPQGAIMVKDTNGAVYYYAGDTAKLYVLNATSWQDISRASGYNLVSDEQWSFTKHGNNLYASNFSDSLQYLTIGGPIFIDITAAPKFKYIATIDDFVVGGFAYDTTDGVVANRLQWSAFNDGTDWPTPGSADATSKQSDQQDLPTGGAIRNIVGGEYGVIIQDTAIQRMTFEGPPTFFRFDPIEAGRGTICPYGVVSIGPRVFYIAEDGFYMFDGQVSHPIGANKVNKTFLDEFDSQYAVKVSAVSHPSESLIMWAVPVTGHTNGVPNKIYCYNYVLDRWSYITDTVELLVRSATAATTLEDLDAIYGNLDAITISLDSQQFLGGSPQLAAFKTDKKLYTYTGSALTATIETKELELTKGRRTFLKKARPIVDGGTTTLSIGTRSVQSGTNSYASAITLNADDEAETLSDSRYFRFKSITSGNFNDAIGVEILEAIPSGRR